MILTMPIMLCLVSCSSPTNGATNYKDKTYYAVYQTNKMENGRVTDAPDNTIFPFSLTAKDVNRTEDMQKTSAIKYDGKVLHAYYFDWYKDEKSEKVSVKEADLISVLNFGDNVLVPDYLNTYYESWYFTSTPVTYFIDEYKIIRRVEETQDRYKEYYYVTEAYAKANNYKIVAIK